MLKKGAITTSIIIAGALASSNAVAAEPVFYTGLNAGWNATEFEAMYEGTIGGNGVVTKETVSGSGAAYSGVVGVKFPISTGYLGMEVNISDSGAEYEASEHVNGTKTLDQTISSDLSYGVSGILAFNLNAHSQLYGIVGYQLTDVESKIASRDLGTGQVTTDSNSDTFGGVRVGIGLETAITSSVSARLEWKHTLYDSEEFEVATADGTLDAELEGNSNLITLGFIGHF
ncbi:hypothetical protein BTO32_15300 [Marinobacter lutaoensis]|uniref:Outer membrane protein beta-barrel domain-containing protein n=1 Tax=Marinobacter lutaoensis TaxID=135739 RepID=A0A1V2DPT6_9GAMM|nr:outer membrane beta-barrel protein [Marinobacter lutaoensis]ONF42637.1 hypothetical protein BTO32_15300 [Marinobacter lutaoensis]